MKTNQTTTIGTQKNTIRKPRRKVRKIWKLIALLIVAITIFSIYDANAERVSSLAAKQLMHGVEDGEEWAVKKFNKYIEKDIYLFDGPKTIKAMADKYELDYNALSADFKSSNYVSLQKYFDHVIKPSIS